MKKRIAILVVVALMLMIPISNAYAVSGDLIRYIPITITVTDNAVKIDGYFLNLNPDCDVRDFTDFELNLYVDGQLLVSGTFGTLNSFTVRSMGVCRHSLTINGSHSLYNGTYSCDDSFYCSFGARFTYVY